jgi:cystathionine beta-synthase
MYYQNILETIGNTPLVKLNNITAHLKGTVLAKVEYFNPGHSIKDRIGIAMIEAAEAAGELKPGGTIVEGTSGNTGMGLALAALMKGYKCIFTTNDKQSKEKVDILRAMGAKVEVCPTAVAADDPRSYYSRAKAIHESTPNSIYVNQYFNLANQNAHYKSTGPEIWEQTEGKVTHYVAGVGTGGTISGTGRYLKEQNPDIKVIGVDSYGSVLKKYHETGEFDENEIYAYITEGIGEDILPDCVDFDVIDQFVKVTDKDGALAARRLAKEEGLFCGYSSGSAIEGVMQLADDLTDESMVVVVLPDHGSRYVGKVYNDDWMKDYGFLEKEARANELYASHASNPVVLGQQEDKVEDAIALMLKYNISQLPVASNGAMVGSLDDRKVFSMVTADPSIKDAAISEIMQPPFPEVEANASIDEVAALINKENGAVLVRVSDEESQIITRHDIIDSIAR